MAQSTAASDDDEARSIEERGKQACANGEHVWVDDANPTMTPSVNPNTTAIKQHCARGCGATHTRFEEF